MSVETEIETDFAAALIETYPSSFWDGSTKIRTKNCGSCRFYIEFGMEGRCYWGKAYKVLADPVKAARKCFLLDHISPREMALQRRQEWERLRKDQRPII